MIIFLLILILVALMFGAEAVASLLKGIAILGFWVAFAAAAVFIIGAVFL